MSDIRSWPASQRASHYRGVAARLRQIAEMETVGRMRDQLLSLAEQYDQLARNLQPSTAKAGALEDS